METPGSPDVCRLEFLTGTLATAYKGPITALVLKDFCMTEVGDAIGLKGTILSLPQGEYRASLVHEGIELARSDIARGFFALSAAAAEIHRARNLQIDIIQSGRHVGTFLLKRERAGEFFTSAFELSDELRDIDLTLLTAGIKDKPGLLKDGEDMIAHIAARERDWAKLSEEINSFSRNLFWMDREAYSRCFPIFVRFSLGAAENPGPGGAAKPVSNFISLIALPLEQTAEWEQLAPLFREWLTALQSSSADLSPSLERLGRVILDVHDRLPGMDIVPLFTILIASARKRMERAPVISRAVLDALERHLAQEEPRVFDKFREETKSGFLEAIAAAEALLLERGSDAAGKIINLITVPGPTEEEMVDEVMDSACRHLTKESAEQLPGAVLAFVATLNMSSPEVKRKTATGMASIVKKLAGSAMVDACMILLGRISEDAFPVREDILLDAGVAAAILASGSDALVDRYSDSLQQILIPAPHLAGFSNETWAELVNPLHRERISKFLSVLKSGGTRFTRVLVHVICNLSVSGVFIPDDALFQREISAYLNSGALRENFLLNYLLLRKLPVYHSEVAATGKIRDYTTEIDSWGNDAMLYFLRKQTHVNASNYNVLLVEDTIKSWVYEDPDILKEKVPDEVLRKMDRGLLKGYSSVIRELFRSLGILDEEGLHLERILQVPESDIRMQLKSDDTTHETWSKVVLLCLIYREISRKYMLTPVDVQGEYGYDALRRLVGRARELSRIVLSPGTTEPQESLYFKRHIAFGIPSVMGTYHEPKFDALGDFLRVEETIRVVLERMISEISGRAKTFAREDISQLLSCLDALHELFGLHGLANFQVDEVKEILATNSLRISQVIDLLRLWQKELLWMVNVCHRTFHAPLVLVLKKFPADELPEYLKKFDPRGKDFIHKAADIIIRDLINDVVGFSELDRLIDGLVVALRKLLGSGTGGDLLMEGAGEAPEYSLISKLSNSDAMRLAPFIGGKAKNLVYLNIAGLSVPAAVVFSAAHTDDHAVYTESRAFMTSLKKAVKEIEGRTGLTFGDKRNPLLLSVRSGSYISMPGILSSVLYCGMNESTVKGLIARTGSPRMGWDSYRRFIEHYAEVVHGLDLSSLAPAAQSGPGEKRGLEAVDMEEVVRSHLAKMEETGLGVPEDPYEQLGEAVKAVYGSWYGKKAAQFRRAMEVSPSWGTSVTLMEMIPGNQPGSGTSVFFTRRPPSMEEGIYGETRENATGDDLVHGRFLNIPLSRGQTAEGKTSLEEKDAELFEQHRQLARQIERAMGGLPQEVEVTYIRRPEGGRLIYVLQTKRMEFHHGFTERFDDVCRMESNIIGRGIGVYGGAFSGIATFSDSVDTLRKLRLEQRLPVVLLRRSASTDDVALMPEIDGIITSAGGATSHAAILAQKFGVTAVVGCGDMRIAEENGKVSANIGSYRVTEGAHISIDGATGLVYAGLCMLTVRSEGR